MSFSRLYLIAALLFILGTFAGVSYCAPLGGEIELYAQTENSLGVGLTLKAKIPFSFVKGTKKIQGQGFVEATAGMKGCRVITYGDRRVYLSGELDPSPNSQKLKLKLSMPRSIGTKAYCTGSSSELKPHAPGFSWDGELFLRDKEKYSYEGGFTTAGAEKNKTEVTLHFRCPQDEPYAGVRVEAAHAGAAPEYRQDRTAAELTDQDEGPHERLGLYRGTLKVNSGLNSSAARNDGLVCYAVDSIIFRMDYGEAQISIPKEYEPGSCNYQAVKDHEDSHYYWDNFVVNEYMKKIEAGLDAYARRLPSRAHHAVVENSDRADREFKEGMNAVVAPLLDEMKNARSAMRADLDAPIVKERVFERCADW